MSGYSDGVRVEHAVTYVLEFPRPDEWITPNQRDHWAVKAAKTKAWRTAAAVHARAAKIPALDRIEVIAEARYTNSSRSRDVDRIGPTVKAAIDGIADAGVIVSDDSRHLLSVTYREGEPVKGVARLRLIIVDRGELDGAA